MTLPQSPTEDNVRRVFLEGFAARDLAEPLASFDATTDSSSVRKFMERRPLRVVGIRVDGLVTGYVEQDHVDDRPLSEQALPLTDAAMVVTAAPFQDLVKLLDVHRFLIVTALGQPIGVIVRNDLQKAPMRMWLFGMISLFDMKITRILKHYYANDSWVDLISKSRLEKAQQLQAERARRKQSIDLMDCLQLGDKGQLLAKSLELRQHFWNQSRKHIEKVVKQLEKLRNNLAHSQDIVSENWEAIVRMAEALESLLDAPGGRPANASHAVYVTDEGTVLSDEADD